MDQEKVRSVEIKICTQIALNMICFFKKLERHIFCMLCVPRVIHMEKAQRMVSGLGPLSATVWAVPVRGGSLEATWESHVDALGDFRPWRHTSPVYYTSAPVNKSCHLH